MTNETKEQDAGKKVQYHANKTAQDYFNDGKQAYHAELEKYLREASLECESGEAELRSSWIIEHMQKWLSK